MDAGLTFCISDLSHVDCPIVFASANFYADTGYSSEAVIGRNCRFLQGPGTEQAELDKIRRGIKSLSAVTATLTNYKADGR